MSKKSGKEQYMDAKYVVENPNKFDHRDVARAREFCNGYEAGQHETIVIGMTGEVVKMGTMFVDDEKLTGVFVMCDPDEFTKQTTNILYRNVKIVPFDECQ